MDTEQLANRALALISGAVSAILASVGLALGVLLAAMIADTITAVVANRKGNLSPEEGVLGWRRKVNEVVMVLLLAIVQTYSPIEGVPAAQATAGILIGFEVMSVLRNVASTSTAIGALLAPFFPAKVRTDPPAKPQEG